jgi:hypothetical protein
VWHEVADHLGDRLGMGLRMVTPVAVEPPAVLVVRLEPTYNWVAARCAEPEARHRLEDELSRRLGQVASVRFEREELPDGSPHPSGPSRAERADELGSDPLVLQVAELFEARRVRVDFEDHHGPGDPPG